MHLGHLPEYESEDLPYLGGQRENFGEYGLCLILLFFFFPFFYMNMNPQGKTIEE